MSPTKDYATILPGLGIEGVILGMSKDDVKAVMGDPEGISATDFGDGSDSISFDYPQLGLSFDFNSDADYILDTVRIERSDIRIFDQCIVGLSIVDTLRLFASRSEFPDPDPLDLINDDGDRMTAYDFEGVGLAVWFLNDALNVVQVGTLWKDNETAIYPWENTAQ